MKHLGNEQWMMSETKKLFKHAYRRIRHVQQFGTVWEQNTGRCELHYVRMIDRAPYDTVEQNLTS